ncbi:VOC family protein [Pseudonocardia sp. RS11V-5]|uniref:VOC family protein n=1 Tax=Pseudonocardia terrae TaxID=2905831 RepID=UPI001E51B7EF|nr:VOC family protein [Pseudonocardia terrae]MCE3551288.1 VOC family protein [Pseudonocardia terrae]
MLRLRWLTLLTGDPEALDARITGDLGLSRCAFEAELEGFGVSSAIYPLGPDRFLEVCAPVREGTSAARRLERAGEGMYMVIVQVGDLDGQRERLAAHGIRVVAEFDRPQTRGRWASLHLHPADTGAALLSLDVSDPPEDFTVVEGPWREHVRTGVVTDLRGIEVVGPAERWAAATGAPLDGAILRLDDATVTFRDGPAEAVTTVLLEAREDREVDLGGVRFVLRRPQP